jgi:hypothetical protein
VALIIATGSVMHSARRMRSMLALRYSPGFRGSEGMRVLMVFLMAGVLVGCGGTKSVVRPWNGSVDPKPAHQRDVCMLNIPLPEGIEAELLGRGVANQHWYGGHAAVKAALADVSRRAGADVVADLHYRQKPGPLAVVRPEIWGAVYSLKSPETFDCEALGGAIYRANGATTSSQPKRQASSSQDDYDQCIARVMKVKDEKLRLDAMAMCDSAGQQ